ncbi:MAG TPA: flagellar hook capping FlgD N-terminal domain-containing protein [Acidimicrobiia bacterium]|nr:flagellar hook capping FlgD N-terminal domain-containing protein [Acidimicrobiia bacterium]
MTAIDPTLTTNPYAGTNQPPQINRPDQFGKDTFMKLLVAELQYQNPLQPTDPSQFMAQSAQFSVLEQLQNLTSTVQSQANANQMVMASALVGKTVTYSDNGVDTTATVSAVKFDPTNASPPALSLSTGKDIPMSAVTEVNKT